MPFLTTHTARTLKRVRGNPAFRKECVVADVEGSVVPPPLDRKRGCSVGGRMKWDERTRIFIFLSRETTRSERFVLELFYSVLSQTSKARNARDNTTECDVTRYEGDTL
jgi:hypothetical protein